MKMRIKAEGEFKAMLMEKINTKIEIQNKFVLLIPSAQDYLVSKFYLVDKGPSPPTGYIYGYEIKDGEIYVDICLYNYYYI